MQRNNHFLLFFHMIIILAKPTFQLVENFMKFPGKKRGLKV